MKKILVWVVCITIIFTGLLSWYLLSQGIPSDSTGFASLGSYLGGIGSVISLLTLLFVINQHYQDRASSKQNEEYQNLIWMLKELVYSISDDETKGKQAYTNGPNGIKTLWGVTKPSLSVPSIFNMCMFYSELLQSSLDEKTKQKLFDLAFIKVHILPLQIPNLDTYPVIKIVHEKYGKALLKVENLKE